MIHGSAARGSGTYAVKLSRGAITISDRPGSPPAGEPAVSAARGAGPAADLRTNCRAAVSLRSPTDAGGSPPGEMSHGSVCPPSRTSTRPTPDPDSTAAIAAPTRPAPRTWTRIARRAASRRIPPPGSGWTTESDARSGRCRSRAPGLFRNASASGPPARTSSTSPAFINRRTKISA